MKDYSIRSFYSNFIALMYIALKPITMKKSFILFAISGILVFFGACKKSSSTSDTNGGSTDSLSIFKKVYGVTADIYQEGDYVVFKTNGMPDHKSPYYQGTNYESTKYEAYNGSNTKFSINPNRIAAQSYTFKIPMHPVEATTKAQTPMGPIGVSLNGVPLFNQYAAGRVQLTSEINSFDQYGGHPAQAGDYHYHVEPTWLTTKNGRSALIGFLLDGFPVYGPVEGSKELVSADLDAYHGHTCATLEFPKGIYHYHITADAPYLNGDGFFGTAGTVSK